MGGRKSWRLRKSNLLLWTSWNAYCGLGSSHTLLAFIVQSHMCGFPVSYTCSAKSCICYITTKHENSLASELPPDRKYNFALPSVMSSCGWTSLVAQTVKRLPTMRETWVRSLGWEDLLEKEMATHSSILAWKIPWREEPDRLQSMGSQGVGHD